MMELDEMPNSVRELVTWLQEQGFALSEEQRKDGNNQRLVFERDGWRIEVVADRADWSVAVASPGGRFVHPDIWEAYLDGFPLAGDLSPLQHQIEFVRQDLERIRAAAGPDVDRELKRMDEEYSRRLLGIGPPE